MALAISPGLVATAIVGEIGHKLIMGAVVKMKSKPAAVAGIVMVNPKSTAMIA